MMNMLNRICLALDAIHRLLADAMAKDVHAVELSNPSLEGDKLLGIEDVKRILGISRTTYYRFVNTGKLIPRKIGDRHCYYLSDLDIMIQESKRRGRN